MYIYKQGDEKDLMMLEQVCQGCTCKVGWAMWLAYGKPNYIALIIVIKIIKK